jgi:hypothetical protein
MLLPGRGAALRWVRGWQDGVKGDAVHRPYGKWKPRMRSVPRRHDARFAPTARGNGRGSDDAATCR